MTGPTMQRVSSLVSKDISNYLTNRATWNIFYNAKSEGLSGDGTTDDYADLSTLITTTINGAEATIIFPPGTYKIGTNITIPSNVTLFLTKGAMLSPDSGKTITINGPIDAGIWKIFTGSGTIAGSPKVDAFYPQWWGAVGDGVTDDTVAIQTAITAIKTAGSGSLYIPNGTFIISSKLSFPSNIHIFGHGTIKAKSGIAGFVMLGNDDTVNGNSNISVEGITIDGNRQNASSNTEFDFGLDIRNIQYVYVNNINVKNCGGDGIYLGKGTANGCRDVIIENNVFDNCNRNGISVIYGDTILIESNTFKNLSGNPGAGVDIEPNAGDTVYNVLVTKNRSINCAIGLEAYAIASVNQIIDSNFINNKISNCTKGILINSVTDFTVQSNKIYKCTQTGIVLDTTIRATVKNNDVVDCNTSDGGYFGIHLFQNNQSTDISENKVIVSVNTQYQTYNIYETGTGNSNNRIRNNVLYPFRTAALFIGGTNTIDVMNARYDDIPNSTKYKFGNRTFTSGGTPSGSGVAGDTQFNNNPSAGGISLWTYTSGGWQPVQCGVLTSIASTPAFVGQISIVGGVGYLATGTSSSADWKQITN